MSELSVNLNAATRPAAQAETSVVTDEQRLMVRVKNGDEAAMCELLSRHGEMLARLVGRLTAWHADREDILQEVLLNVWQKSGTYRGEGSLEGWLKRMAVNRCQNHFRAANSIKRLMERFTRLVNPILTSEPEHAVYSNEPDSELQLALVQLTEADRSALVLFYLEEMPGDEVAEILNVNPETLHVRLHRARKRLKQVIEEQSESVV
jgi:RNA polymerase sigma-70 factor (ECF subfamily)